MKDFNNESVVNFKQIHDIYRKNMMNDICSKRVLMSVHKFEDDKEKNDTAEINHFSALILLETLNYNYVFQHVVKI